MNLAQDLRKKLGVDTVQNQQFNIQYGFNGNLGYVVFPQPLQNLTMTVEQIDQMILALQNVKKEISKGKK